MGFFDIGDGIFWGSSQIADSNRYMANTQANINAANIKANKLQQIEQHKKELIVECMRNGKTLEEAENEVNEVYYNKAIEQYNEEIRLEQERIRALQEARKKKKFYIFMAILGIICGCYIFFQI